MKQRENFSTRLGFILVSAGCAIGLGNVWKFPYICGQDGGAIFILIYLLFLFFLGFPILIAEFSVGRGSGMGMAKSFEQLAANGTRWHSLKWLLLSGNYLLMMFYTVVCGWMLYYAYMAGTGALSGLSTDGIAEKFSVMTGEPCTMAFWMLLSVAFSLLVCAQGLVNGIEKITKAMMLLLLGLILVLAGHSLFLPNAMEGVNFYLVPSMDTVRERGLDTIVFDAMSQAFFTLSIGMGAMQIFGSYLKKTYSLAGEASRVVVLDTFVALMAGFIIIPACFAYGIEPDAGPSLLFITLPNVFNHMTGGIAWGTAFFIFMSFAALSTVIAVFENIFAFYIDQFSWTRKKAVAIHAILLPLLSLPTILGFNLLAGIQPMGAGSSILDLEDFLVSSNVLPLGSLFYLLFCTRKNGWGWEHFLAEANSGSGIKLPPSLKFYMSYILPAVIAIIYLKGYYDTFAKQGTEVLVLWMGIAVMLLISIFTIALSKGKR